MAIDYRKEVDSGFDRKRMVESVIIALLKEGVPLDIITTSPSFNPKHEEMVRNLERGYILKEEQILEIYGGYGKELDEQVVPDIYADVSHPVGGELYPMEEEEEIEKFKELESLKMKIEKAKRIELENLEFEKNKILFNITEFKNKFPLIENIVLALNKLKNIKEDNNYEEKYFEVLREFGLNKEEIANYDELYKKYIELQTSLEEVINKSKDLLDGKVMTSQIRVLEVQKEKLISEIYRRNVKLVNGFIRQKYADLLVDTDDMFQVCSFGLLKAINDFDPNLCNKFSTPAYAYMDIEVKSSFKELTGYTWDHYWGIKKVRTILRTVSQILERKVSVDELIEFGLLDMSEAYIRYYYEEPGDYSFTDLYPKSRDEEGYRAYEIDSQYENYYGDDEIKDYDTGEVEQILSNTDAFVFHNELKEELRNVLKTLTEREQLVISLLFGLDDCGAKSLEEVGKIMGLSRERVRQIEAKALRKLRHPYRAKTLKDFYGFDFSENTTLKK